MTAGRKPLIIRRRLGDASGAAAVEFALLMVPLLGLLMGSIQIAMIFLFGQELQSVAQKAARQLMTGTAQKAGLTQTTFGNQVCGMQPAPFVCGNLMIDVESGSSFNAINTSQPTLTYNGSGAVSNTWNYAPGNPGDIVILRLMYNWPVFGGTILTPGLSNQPGGASLMIGTAVFKNEPYS